MEVTGPTPERGLARSSGSVKCGAPSCPEVSWGHWVLTTGAPTAWQFPCLTVHIAIQHITGAFIRRTRPGWWTYQSYISDWRLQPIHLWWHQQPFSTRLPTSCHQIYSCPVSSVSVCYYDQAFILVCEILSKYFFTRKRSSKFRVLWFPLFFAAPT